MKLKFLFISIFLIVFNLSQLSAKVILELVDFENVKDQKTGQSVPTVYLGNTFKVTVVISGSGDFGGLEVLGLENFKIQGTSQSESSVYNNSKFTKKINFTYDVYADKEGTFTLGPARIRENGAIINSEPEKITFNITKEPAGRVVKTESGRYEVEGSNFQGYELFCKSKVDKSKVVVGEPIVFTISIYARGSVATAGIEPPNFSGFLSKEISQVVKREEVLEGKKYSVLDKKYLLLPTQMGDLHISPITVNFNVQIERKRQRGSFWGDAFFDAFGPGFETKRATSQEVLITVNFLPVYSGKVDGVGAFTNFKVEVDKTEAIINEPILFAIEIEGKGNLDQIVAPKLNLPNFVTNYESKTDLQQNLSQDFIGGKKRFEFVIQVGKQGEFEIQAQKFTYFDTASRTYKTLSSKPILLNIKTPPEGQQVATSSVLPLKLDDQKEKKSVEFKKDINFIEENFSRSSEKEEKQISLLIFLILFLIPLFFSPKVVALLGLSTIKSWFRNKYSTRKSASKLKNDLEKIVKNEESLKIYQFFLKYFAYKFDVSVSAITEDLIGEKLVKQGWQKEKIGDFISYLNQCASLSFASSSKIDFDSKKLLEKSKYWFFMLESKN